MPSLNKALEMRDSSFRGPDLKLFVRDVRDRQERKRAVTVRSWSTIKDVKHVIQQMLHVPPNAQRLYFGPLLTSGGELPNHRTLHDAGIYRSGETLLLDIKGSGVDASGTMAASSSSASSLRLTADVCVSSSMIDSCPRMLRRTVQQARRGLAMGLKPQLVLDGSGGTYFLHDARKVRVAVFKPADEEPYAENNPRGYLKQVLPNAEQGELSLRAGVEPGEACIREVAAFLLDHEGFSGVPMTTLAEARHPAFNTNGARLNLAEGGASVGPHSLNALSSATPAYEKKVGSFQEYVHSECTMDDLSPSKLSVEEVHKIAILDIRIMNADRNAANLLCKRRRDNSLELVPIDHGYCLRSVCDVSWMDWCWLDWPQLKKPLSKKHKDYILKLDVDADALMLKERLNIERKALDNFRASTKLLQTGVRAGLSLYEIATMCCRNDNLGEIPSKLEVLTSMATELATKAVENGRWHHTAASRALADQLSPGRGSLLMTGQRPGQSVCIFKSASSENILSLAEAAEMRQPNTISGLPGMANSSVSSDSGSDTGDLVNEREECDEWAAFTVVDVVLDKSMSMLRSKARSPSVESDQSADATTKFWYVRPDEDVDASSDTGSWRSSPECVPDELEAEDESEAEDEMPPSFDEQKSDSFKSPTVEFSDAVPCYCRIPPATVSLSTFKSKMESESDVAIKFPKPGALARSQSYAAFSAHRSSSTVSAASSEMSRNGSVSNESEQFRVYFSKFVDLVITIETTALASPEQVIS